MLKSPLVPRFAALLTCLALGAVAFAADDEGGGRTVYFIDPTHSSIEFEVPFMGIARVAGSFDQFYGTVEHDPAELTASAAEVVIRVASIDTRNVSRDEDLRSESYFDVESFPAMVFRSREIATRESGPVLVGDLTIRDTTREVQLSFSILGALESPDGREMGVEATTTIDRRDFGISQGQFSGDQVFIGNDVTIRLLLRLREPSADKKQMAEGHVPVGVDPGLLLGYAGRYRVTGIEGELGVHLLAGELVLERAGKLLRMIPQGDGRFRLQDFAAFVSFGRDGVRRSLVFERVGRAPQTYLSD
jgi:polyisoprenoid-binding protein YceI